MTPRRTISRQHRDALHQDLMLTLSGISNVNMHLNHGRPQKAKEAGDEARNVMRLLDDLGWDQADLREEFDLTMPDTELVATVRMLKDRAEECLRINARDLVEVVPGEFQTPGEFEEWAADTRQDNDQCLDVQAASAAVLGED